MGTSRLQGGLDYTQLKQVWRGDWDQGTVYNLNDTVRVNGKAYVMQTTVHADNKYFGQEYKPGVDTVNWKLVTNGSVYKGDWSFKDRNYVGDIVRFNGDFYQCVTDNFGGHPIYENGALSTKWVKIAENSRADKSRYHLWFSNMGPMGWTRNMCEDSMNGPPGYINVSTINGNYEYAFYGREYGCDGHGFGERSNGFTSGYQSQYPDGVWRAQMRANYDFFDYIDGYRPSITGGEPRLIQISGTDAFTLTLFDNGEVYHTGYGGHGQSGDGTTNTYRMNRRVGRSGARGTGVLRDVNIIKVGHSCKSGNSTNQDTHTCFAISDAGAIYTWGYNGYGQCGDGTTNNLTVPKLIPQSFFNNKKIVDAWMWDYNYQKSMALTDDGELWAWGYGGDGSLGVNSFRNQYRPIRVKYNWAKYGGIKKVIPQGAGAEGGVIVLTNDGQLHGVGNIGDGSYPVYGAGTTMDTYVSKYTPLAHLLEVRANSLGIGNKSSQVGNAIDVTRNVEDFWYFGSGGMQHTLIAKEKGTGVLYGWGYNGDAQLPMFRKNTNFDEYNSNNPNVAGTNLAFPTPLNMGNMTDIKYVAKTGATSTTGYIFQNSDGRLWTNGNTAYTTRGIGNFGANPAAQFRRNAKLPWETFFTDYSPTQPRTTERANIIQGFSEDTGGGYSMITTNNRYLVSCDVSWYYGLDPSCTVGTDGSNYSHPTRVDM